MDQAQFNEHYERLFDDLPTERRETLETMVSEMALDQRLMPQLAPEALELFNASTADRPGVRYGSVVTATRAPGLRTAVRAGLDPYAQASHALFTLVWWIASRTPLDRIPALPLDIREQLTAVFGAMPSWRDSDGVVPTLSQPWGELIHCAYSDHLDTIGHFHGPDLTPPHRDWVTAGSDFRRPDFDLLWDRVADFVAESLSI